MTYINIADGNATSHFCGIEFDFGIQTRKPKVVGEAMTSVSVGGFFGRAVVELRFVRKKRNLGT